MYIPAVCPYMHMQSARDSQYLERQACLVRRLIARLSAQMSHAQDTATTASRPTPGMNTGLCPRRRAQLFLSLMVAMQTRTCVVLAAKVQLDDLVYGKLHKLRRETTLGRQESFYKSMETLPPNHENGILIILPSDRDIAFTFIIPAKLKASFNGSLLSQKARTLCGCSRQ